MTKHATRRTTPARSVTKATRLAETTESDGTAVIEIPWQPTNPFAGQGLNEYDFTETGPQSVDLEVLKQAISSTFSVDQDDLHLASSIQTDGPITAENPLYVFVASTVPLDQAKIQGLIDHPAPVPSTPVATTPSGVTVVSDDPTVADLVAQLKAGDTLTTKELSAVLKSIVGG